MKLVHSAAFALVAFIYGAAAQAQEADARGIPSFQRAIDQYAALHDRLVAEVGPLRPTARAAEFIAASDRLAAAIQRARPRARQGDFFTTEARAIIVQRIGAALNGQELRSFLGADEPDERSSLRIIRTYARFPTDGPLATMPPVVLDALPTLPEFLEYRFVGNDLVLRDRDARLVLDWIKGVVPGR